MSFDFEGAIADAEIAGDPDKAQRMRDRWAVSKGEVDPRIARATAPVAAVDPADQYAEDNGLTYYSDLRAANEGRVTNEELDMQRRALLQGATFGLADDIYAAGASIGALFESPDVEAGTNDDRPWFGADSRLEDFWDSKKTITQELKAERDAYAQENQGEALLLELVGGALTGGAGATRAAAATTARAAAAGANTAVAAGAGAGAAGAAEGLVYGIGTLDHQFNDGTSAAKHIATSTLFGGVGGATLGFAAKAVSNKVAANRVFKTAQKDADTMSARQAGMNEIKDAVDNMRADNPSLSPTELVNKVHADTSIGSRYTTDQMRAAMVANSDRAGPLTPTEHKLMKEMTDARVTGTPAEESAKLGKGGAFGESMEYIFGSVRTRISNIDKATGQRLDYSDANIMAKNRDRLSRVEGMEGVTKNPLLHSEFKKLYDADDAEGITAMFNRHGDEKMIRGWAQTRKVMAEMGDELDSVGFPGWGQGGQLPRVVKDPEGLARRLGSLPKAQKTFEADFIAMVDKTEAAKNYTIKTYAQAKERFGEEATHEWMGEWVQKNKNRGGAKAAQIGTTKGREIETITDDISEFYADPLESISRTIKDITNNVEERRFFGNGSGEGQRVVGLGDNASIDIDLGITKYMADLGIDATNPQYDMMKTLLESRFKTSKQSPNAAVRAVKNLGLLSSLGNMKSAMIQLADIPQSFRVNGFRESLSAIAETAQEVFTKANPNKINAKNLGAAGEINASFETAGDVGKLAKGLDVALTVSGFKTIDRAGKSIFLKSAHKKAVGLATKNPVEFKKQYGDMFGPNTDALIKELSDPNHIYKMSGDAKALLLSELADIQPIFMSNMPQGFMNHPNGRLAYVLKSFALQQTDILRREVVQEMKKGNVVQGARNLRNYALATGLPTYVINEGRQAIWSNNEDPIELGAGDITMGVFWHMLSSSTAGIANQYAIENLSNSNGAGDAVGGYFVPSIGVLGGAISDVFTALSTDWDEETMEFANLDTVRQLPMVGEFINDYFGDGLEKKAQRYHKRQGGAPAGRNTRVDRSSSSKRPTSGSGRP